MLTWQGVVLGLEWVVAHQAVLAVLLSALSAALSQVSIRPWDTSTVMPGDSSRHAGPQTAGTAAGAGVLTLGWQCRREAVNRCALLTQPIAAVASNECAQQRICRCSCRLCQHPGLYTRQQPSAS